ncbi:YdeI/OmpD-associated family protein [Mucilaginibacter terrae]|uniref:Uncharacterized protein YdeI (YjbR/CyaY-like superfamily) n=1 Tax=Mucilaginibacter terrae TaxID=1955052 RepID=A0ABU3H1U4_9SPHI|nr:YdeI/OmpD-associated family protein [Mucilaginibacter terrae]MDT3404885.1 uncharacterized protein YdeI (YjbR/CyaY-like superfamily) [Mucilaginibacter terrae]
MNAIAKKLLMKPGQHWLLFNAPNAYLSVLDPLPNGLKTSHEAKGDFSGIQLFVLNSAELATSLKHIQPVLKPDTVLWIIYPKKSSGIATDLEMMSSWEEPTKYGLNAVAAAAIDATWTALRFRPQERTKLSDTRNAELENNQYSAWVDVVNKTVTLPPDAEAALQQHPLALTNYDKLSYSNRKEYVLWIVTAKQEKTRTERLAKMVDKLLNGKKNPSDK